MQFHQGSDSFTSGVNLVQFFESFEMNIGIRNYYFYLKMYFDIVLPNQRLWVKLILMIYTADTSYHVWVLPDLFQ